MRVAGNHGSSRSFDIVAGDPEREGSMGIFTTREAAEEFAQGDPFVLHGVVARWHVREWNEVLA